MFSRLVDSRLMDVLAFHFNTFGVIYRAVKSYNADNEEVITFPTIDPTLGTIRCHVERLQNTFVGEFRTRTEIIFTDAFTIALNGYYPTIGQGDQFKLENGELHNIKRVMQEDTKTYTTLTTERINQTGM